MPEPKLFKVKRVDGPTSLHSRLVLEGAVVEVPEGEVYGLTCQESNWAPGDAAAKKVHEAAHAAQLEANDPTPSLPEVPAEPEAVEADEKEND